MSDHRAPASCPIQPTMGPPIGVDPSHARAHSDITRPRISGLADSRSGRQAELRAAVR